MLSNYSLSETFLIEASIVYKRLGESLKAFYADLNRVYNLVQLYRNQQVIDLIQRLIPVAGQLQEQTYIGDLYTYLAEAYYNELDYDSSFYFVREAILHLPRSERGYAFSTLGLLFQECDQTDSAFTYFFKANELLENRGVTDGILMNQARMASSLLHMGKTDKADSLFQTVLELSSSYENIIYSMRGAALCHYHNGEFQEAAKKLLGAIDIIEIIYGNTPPNNASTAVLSDKISCYSLLSYIYFQTFNKSQNAAMLDSALTIFERGKCKFLHRNMQPNQPGPDPKLISLYNQLSQVQKAFFEKSANLDSLEHERKHIEDSIYIYQMILYPNQDSIQVDSKIDFSLTALQTKLTLQQALLYEYVITDIGCFVFVIEGQAVKAHSIPINGDSLSMVVQKFLNEINHPPGIHRQDSIFWDLGQRLWDHLIPEEHVSLTDHTNLIFIADGILNYLPFEALSDARTKFPATLF